MTLTPVPFPDCPTLPFAPTILSPDNAESRGAAMTNNERDLRGPSHVLLDGPGRAPARAMLRATGLTDEDLSKPLIGIANTWIEIGPCNFHLRRLSAKVKEGIRAAGG